VLSFAWFSNFKPKNSFYREENRFYTEIEWKGGFVREK